MSRETREANRLRRAGLPVPEPVIRTAPESDSDVVNRRISALQDQLADLRDQVSELVTETVKLAQISAALATRIGAGAIEEATEIANGDGSADV